MDRDKVFAFFALFADLEGEAAQKCRPLCDGAAAGLMGRLRPELEHPLPPEDMECLCLAAAAQAWRDWQAVGGFAAGEIKVGAISLRSAQGGDRAGAEDICRHFEARAAHLLAPPTVLRQVGP